MSVTAQMIEEYLQDNNDAKRITEQEALARGGVKIERQFHADAEDRNPIYADHDPIGFMAGIAIDVSEVFMRIFADHRYRVGWFTGYKVVEAPASMGRVFNISTIAVSMTESEWHGH